MRLLSFLILSVLGLSSCTSRLVRVQNPDLVEKYLSEIAGHNKEIIQLKAAVDIKGIGLIDHLFHEQADIIAATPYFLRISMRSFFEVPSNIIASNGKFLTIYDFSGTKNESYQRMPLSNDSIIDIFNLKIHPRLLAEILLSRVPLSNAESIEISQRGTEIEIKANLIEGFSLQSIFDEQRKIVLKTRLVNIRTHEGFELSYENFCANQGILFPMTYVVRSIKASPSFNFAMRVKSLELNGPKIPEEDFYLPPT